MKRVYIILIGLLLVIGTLIGISIYFSQQKVTEGANNEIGQMVKDVTNGAYTMVVGDIQLSFDGLIAKQIELIPISSYFDTTQSLSHSASVKINQVEVKIENLLSFDPENASIKMLTVDSILIKIKETNATVNEESILPKDEQTGQALLKKFAINHIDVSYTNKDASQTTEFRNGQVNLTNLSINGNDNLKYEELHVNFESSKGTFHQYELSTDKVSLDGNSKQLSIANINFSPTTPQQKFLAQSPVQKNYIKGTIQQIAIDNLNFRNNTIEVDKMVFYRPIISLTKDKNKPENEKPKPLIHQLFFSSELSLDCKMANIVDGKVTINTIEKDKNRLQSIALTQFTAQTQPLSPNASSIKSSISFGLNSKGNIKANYLFVNDKQGSFDMTGTATNIPLELINPYIPQQIPVQFKEGEIEKLEFNVKANDRSSVGTTSHKTHNITLIGNPEEKRFSKKVVNHLITSGSNLYTRLKTDKKTIEGKINHVRKPNKQIFHYSFHSILDGILDSYGITTEKK